MAKRCIFNNKIECNFETTNKCDAEKESDRIYQIPFGGKQYCIGTVNGIVKKVYIMKKEGKRIQLKKNDIPSELKDEISVANKLS